MVIFSATVARASDFVVFLKVLIIISSMLVFTSSELISTIAEQIFYNAPRAINLRLNTALNIVFIFCKNLQI